MIKPFKSRQGEDYRLERETYVELYSPEQIYFEHLL